MPSEDELKDDIQDTTETAETATSEDASAKADDTTVTADVAEADTVKSVEFEKVEVESEDFSADDGPVTVKPVKFASFEDAEHSQGEINKNLDILMDIKLQMTVELGRTELPIKKVLELTRGSIIELAKVAGEPVELFANGKLVAHGEVVVIEDNFGLRITNITAPEDRLKGV